jgi:signal transduction histidine kinase
MVVVKGSVSEIEDRVDDPVVAREGDRIRKRVDALLRLADNARMIALVLRDELLGRGPVAVVDAADDIAAQLRDEYPSAAVEVDVPEEAVVAAGDALPIVLDELCRNALRHNPAPEPECRVSITGRLAADRIEVTVADNGSGLPEFEKELLTGDVMETPTQHGQGLGLWLVQWLVEKVDGSISITASGTDGTAITISLPREAGE